MQNPLDHASTASDVYGKTQHSECLSLLRESQNADGGWAFHTGEQSRVEPTCWAFRALFNSEQHADGDAFRKAVTFIEANQLADGSWPAASQMSSGSWITSLTCSVLGTHAQSMQSVKAGLKWICEDFPR